MRQFVNEIALGAWASATKRIKRRIAAVVRAYRDYTRFWVSRFDEHPNALAHRLAGEHLAEVLGPLWLAASGARGRAPAGNVPPSVEAPHGVSQRPDPVDRNADDVVRR